MSNNSWHQYILTILSAMSVRLEKARKAIFLVAATLHDSAFPVSFIHSMFLFCIPKEPVDTLSLRIKFMDQIITYAM